MQQRNGKNDLHTAIARRLLVLGVAVMLCYSMLGSTIANHSGDDDVVQIPYGTDDTYTPRPYFHATELVNCPQPPCDVDPEDGYAHADTGYLRSGTDTRHARTGLNYEFVPRCDGQHTHLSADLVVRYDYALDAAWNGEAEAVADIRLYPTATSNQPLILHSTATGDSGGTDRFRTVEIDPDFGETYTMLLGGTGHATARATAEEDTRARAQASSWIRDVTFEFGDTDAPEATGSIIPANGAGQKGDSFLGWYSVEMPTITVDAGDVYEVDGVPVAGSCVSEVVIRDDGVTKDTLPVNDAEDPVSYEVPEEQGRFNIQAIATDYQGNGAAALSFRFGIDTRPPVTEVEGLDPAIPGGDDEWYNSYHPPTYGLKCDDRHGLERTDVSDCSEIHYQFVVDGVPESEESAESNTTTVDVPEGESVVLRYWSEDHALNLETAHSEAPLKVDLTLPVIEWTLSRDSTFSNGWYNDSVVVEVECVNEKSGPSLCRSLDSTPAGETVSDIKRRFNFTEAGETLIDVTASDHAGHITTDDRDVNLDLVDPPAIPELRVGNELKFQDSCSVVDVMPRLEWDGVVDDLSGVRHYEVDMVHETGRTYSFTTTRTTLRPAAIMDGEYTVSVRAVDQAGNKGGPAFGLVCVDTKAPEVQFLAPELGHFTLWDGRTFDIPRDDETTIVVGGTTVEISAEDPTFGMGLVRTELWDHRAVGDPRPITYDDGFRCDGPSSCTWTDRFGGDSAGPARRNLEALSWDDADHRGSATIEYLRVDLSLVEEALPDTTETGLTQGMVFWKPHLGDDFVAYEIHRGDEADFLAGSSTRIESISAQDTLSFVDSNVPVRAEPYYYKVLTKVTSGVGVITGDTTHEAKMVFEGVSGTLPEHLPCTLVTCG